MDALALTPVQHALVGHFFALALGAHLVGLVYFLANAPRVAPRYRVGTVLSVAVMVASGYLFARLGASWDEAFTQVDGRVVGTGKPFDGGLRYVNWLVTVPVLLVQSLYAFDLARDRVLRLRTVLVASGVLMVLAGYVGQLRAGTDDAWLLGWGAAGTVPFVVLLVVLLPLLRGARTTLPPSAGTTAGHLAWVVLFSWGLYPVAYLVPAVSASATGVVVAQGLFTAADVGSKVLYGILLAKVLRLRSAADGYGPAREPADGAVGPAPEHEPYPDRQEAQR
ncbi:MAG TPA: bacteriorhodopsin [Mycobacteriales bacterium]|nr:bacteriorhodopsin [Mycobacteriales bacterium]